MYHKTPFFAFFGVFGPCPGQVPGLAGGKVPENAISLIIKNGGQKKVVRWVSLATGL